MLVGFLSLAGFPPFTGFFAKLFVLQAGFAQGAVLATGIALGFGVISLYYNFTTYQRYAWGTGGGEVGAAGAGIYGSVAFLSAFAVIFGLGAYWLFEWAQLVAAQITNPELYIAAMRDLG